MNEPPADLLESARAAWEHAYAPYSRFKVGASLRAQSGRVYPGANVENGSYGLSRCAEQAAVLAMATAGEREFSEILVYTSAEIPASPCGACRQIMHEFSPQATVYLVNDRGDARVFSVAELLPGAFVLAS